ncbi:MAG: VUT family protein [Alphaproteobacteria bacterium]
MKSIDNRSYIPLVMALGAFTYSLNYFNKIFACALVFVFLALIINLISELYGKARAMKSMALCAIASFCLLWNFDYYIYGRAVDGVVLASLLSVVASTYCGANVFAKLRRSYSFNTSNLISLIICASVDGLVMSAFFITKYSMGTVLFILAQEVSFKCLYSLSIFALLFVGAIIVGARFAQKRTPGCQTTAAL